MTNKLRRNLLFLAIFSLIGPNGLYLYTVFTDPGLNLAAIKNPIAQAFMAEALILLGMFLYYVFYKTNSIKQVFLYLVLSFVGSLAFSFPLFLYLQEKNYQTKR